jgi:hypothetical protein
MKKLFWTIAVVICAVSVPLYGQIQFNPQIGVNFTDVDIDLDDFPIDPRTEGKAGVLVGADVRIGNKAYVQPGLFVIGNRIEYSFATEDYEVTRWAAKLKGLVGYKLVDSGFRLRVMGGPTYDFQLGINNDNNPFFDEDDFKDGIFALDAGVGIDILFLTAEVGYSWAFTDAFNEDFFENEPRYETIYVTVGLVFGE